MDLFELMFPDMARDDKIRRLSQRLNVASASSQAHGPRLDAVEAENLELRAYLSALIEMLLEQGLIDKEAFQRKVQSYLPPPLPPPPPEEENPFANLKL